MITLVFCGVTLTGKPPKKDEPFKDERKRVDPSGLPPKASSDMPRSGNRGHPMHPPPMGPPGGYGSHKDIKLTLLNKVNGKKHMNVTAMKLSRSA